jgi:DNA-binding NarL/FixJ family response regulator
LSRKIRVLVVDDHPVMRKGLGVMLDNDPEIEVVGEAGNGEEAVEKALELEPQVVLMDIRMPGMSGVEAMQRIKATRPGIAVIVTTVYESGMYVVEALRAGAAGYLVKDFSQELICHAVHAVMDGGATVEGSLLRQTAEKLMGRPSRPGEGESGESWVTERFTPREMEILRLVAQGHGNRQIARDLSLAEVTVKKYVQSILGKRAPRIGPRRRFLRCAGGWWTDPGA